MQTLNDWYLARLRRRAAQMNSAQKLTPRTLIESDKLQIQQLVSQFADNYDERCKKYLDLILTGELAAQKKCMFALYAASALGLVLIAAASLL